MRGNRRIGLIGRMCRIGRIRRIGRIGRPRRGIILAAVLACLVVAALLAAALVQILVIQARQTRVAEDRAQSFWLAESALQRGLRSIARSPDYRGETWTVPAESLGSESAGVAVIRVEPVNEPQLGAWVRVEARYPDHPLRRIVQTRELFVPNPSQGASP